MALLWHEAFSIAEKWKAEGVAHADTVGRLLAGIALARGIFEAEAKAAECPISREIWLERAREMRRAAEIPDNRTKEQG